MPLATTSCLAPDARHRCEERLKGVRRRLTPPRRPEAPVQGLLRESFYGTARAAAKAGVVSWGALECLAATTDDGTRLRALTGFPRSVAGLCGAALLMGVGKLIAAAQTVSGLERPGRTLTSTERDLLRGVFGDALALEPLRIKTGPCGVGSLTDRPFVHGHVLYLKGWRLSPALLVHEAVHWWQNQNGGADYMLDSLWSQVVGLGYDWRRSVPATPWRDLETEQQARLIEDAFRAGYFDTGRFYYGGLNLSPYLDEAVASLRSGRGAP